MTTEDLIQETLRVAATAEVREGAPHPIESLLRQLVEAAKGEERGARPVFVACGIRGTSDGVPCGLARQHAGPHAWAMP